MIDESQMMLCQDYRGQFVGGGWFGEKMNGCHVYIRRKLLWTREGNQVCAPKWFTEDLPSIDLEAEIWAGRGVGVGNANSGYKVAMTATRHGGKWFEQTDNGHPVQLAVFDCPTAPGFYDARMAEAARAVKGLRHAFTIPITRIIIGLDRNLSSLMQKIYALGGEGGMIHLADCGYEKGRSPNLLRWKFSQD